MQSVSFLKWQLGVRLAIYKSAAELRVLLTPHRHPRASRSGAEAKRTPEQAKRQTEIKGGDGAGVRR